jgi:hypothetical protein
MKHLNDLRLLVEEKRTEVNRFFEFIARLSQLDDLAPCLLFSHHPWSCSELSDRSFTIRKDNDEFALHTCIEIVFGLAEICHPIGPIPILASEHSDEESAWSHSVDPEVWGNRPSPITFLSVFPQAQRRILKEFATYFQKIRDSAEIVINEISNLNIGELLTNDVFLNLFLTKALPPHVQENTVWDFKETYETWLNSGVEQLKVKMACDVAAFANNRGGLLLIGISNNREIEGLNGIEAKKLQTQEILKFYLVNGSELVMFHSIKTMGKNGTPAECLVIIIPQTKDVIDVKKSLGTKETVCPFRISSGIDFKYHTEVEKLKSGVIIENNLFFAKDLADFVYFGKGVT